MTSLAAVSVLWAFASYLLSQIRGSAVPALEWHLELSQGERGKGAPAMIISFTRKKLAF